VPNAPTTTDRPIRSLATEIQFLKGVGPNLARGLHKVGVFTVGDILYYLPRRYDDRRNIPKISTLRPGQFATVRGRIKGVNSRPLRGGKVILSCSVTDGSGVVVLTWFNQPWVKRKLEDAKGDILAYGMVKEASWGVEMNSPEWEIIDPEDEADEFARITPVYPLTDGLAQRTVRRAAQSAVDGYLNLVEDPVPKAVVQKYGLKDLRWSLRELHRPTEEEKRLQGRERVVFDEFLFLQLGLALRRAETQLEVGIGFPISKLIKGAPVSKLHQVNEKARAPKLIDSDADARIAADAEPLWDQVHRMLPFELTGAQKRVIGEIWSDMELANPMNRLVQGDVGSGKTAVAACAMLAAVRSGYQAALMAPTEILAEQHWVNLHRLFAPLGIDVALLVGKQTAKEKKKQIERVAGGEVQIAVGTHALIQEGVEFQKLGFVVIDEQHRFGVMQRAALRGKGIGNPDVLVMTATPIPRTLTMAVYGDLDLSVIDELPPGRRPIKTHWKQPYERDAVYEGVRKLIQEGRQAYFVCPMVGESEKMQAQAAEELYMRLHTKTYPDLRVGLLHGQMKSKEKEEVMERFRAHELDVLVSTTVIEVGVDVPNSSVMVVEDANRFGLSQLHQLRGRVGRGEYQSFCLLIADAKSEEAKTRMEAMRDTTDGFKIADIDLRLRGPGDLLGTRQSGNLDFKVADLLQDSRMLEVARQAAFDIIKTDPDLSKPEHAGLLEKVRKTRTDLAAVVVS
jgi:ATP-dependent DNA helicase RecG